MDSEEHRNLVAQRIKEARELSGLTQVQAAKMLGVHRPTISEIEAGRRKVSTEELTKFADIYDASPTYLLGELATTIDPGNPKLRLAARELEKLDPEALDSLLKVLATFQTPPEDGLE